MLWGIQLTMDFVINFYGFSPFKLGYPRDLCDTNLSTTRTSWGVSIVFPLSLNRITSERRNQSIMCTEPTSKTPIFTYIH